MQEILTTSRSKTFGCFASNIWTTTESGFACTETTNPIWFFTWKLPARLLAPITKTEDTLMLRVLVEFVPDFEGDERRELACAEIHGARIAGMVGDYSLTVREGSNPLADTPAWAVSGDILGHDRAQTVWALVEKISMFALMA